MASDKKAGGSTVHFAHPTTGRVYRDMQEWMSLWQGIWEEHLLEVTRLSNTIDEGKLDARAWVEQGMRMWGQWSSYLERLALFPMTRAQQQREGMPILVFTLDTWAEGADAKELGLGVTLGQGVTLAVTPLRPLGGASEHPAIDRVDLRLSEDRASIRVSLRNLKGDGDTIAPLPPGHYLSLITAADPPKQRPLAMLHVLIQS